MACAADLSPCGHYRYRLSRRWDDAAPRLLVVMLNPSTADETLLDPTATRCLLRARALGFGAVELVNLFALRATDPRALRGADDPVGPGNDAAIMEAAEQADAILCAWGARGAFLGRGAAVARMLRGCGRPLLHLGLTRCGQPRHPLYVPLATIPSAWDEARQTACAG
jgi:hypothetical protein